jgi:hypothetical protein
VSWMVTSVLGSPSFLASDLNSCISTNNHIV